MFSERGSPPRVPGAFATAVAQRRARGEPILDLTVSTFATEGIGLDASILDALGDGAHEPHPTRAAREAVAAALAGEGVAVDPERIVLGASRSEAYAQLFALLCDPGDEVLVPQPSEPSLEPLARLSGVHLAPYALRYDGRWSIDAAELWDAIGERTRAIVVGSPSDATGAYLTREQADALESFRLPIVADEVFGSYPLEAPDDRVRAAALSETLVLTIDALGTRAASPLDLAWTSVSGPADAVAQALARLEPIAECFAGPPRPVSAALARLLASRAAHDAVAARCARNLAALRESCRGTAVSAPRVEGGWRAPLRLPGTEGEKWALRLLERGVHASPGSLYGFPDDEAWLVVGLLSSPADLDSGVEILLELAR